MKILDKCKLRLWTVDRQLGQDFITPEAMAENPFIGKVFRILRGRTKDMLFFIDDIELKADGNHRISYQLITADLMKERNVSWDTMDAVVSKVVKQIIVAAAKSKA